MTTGLTPLLLSHSPTALRLRKSKQPTRRECSPSGPEVTPQGQSGHSRLLLPPEAESLRDALGVVFKPQRELRKPRLHNKLMSTSPSPVPSRPRRWGGQQKAQGCWHGQLELHYHGPIGPHLHFCAITRCHLLLGKPPPINRKDPFTKILQKTSVKPLHRPW